MRVRDLMTVQVVTLDVDETLSLADDIMRLGRIRHMPIVSKGHLVGILSQRDLFRAAISSALKPRPEEERQWLATVAVRDVMTSPAITISADASIRKAVGLMLEKRIGCLPVVQGAKIAGLLSETDCLRYLARVLDISEVKENLPELPD